jgi:hypothetical protein
MMAERRPPIRRLALSIEAAIRPIFVFALLNAMLCWGAAWVFRDVHEFSMILLVVGCLPIVVAVCAYLFVLVNRVERDG